MAIRNSVSIIIFNSISVDDDGVICPWLHSISCYDLMAWELSNNWCSISFQITSRIISFLAFFCFNNISSIIKHLSNFHATSTTSIIDSNVIRSCSHADRVSFLWFSTFDVSSFVERTKLGRVEEVYLRALLLTSEDLYAWVTCALLVKFVIFWQATDAWLVKILTSTLAAHLVTVSSTFCCFVKVTHAEWITFIDHNPLHIFKLRYCWIHNKIFWLNIFFTFLDSL